MKKNILFIIAIALLISCNTQKTGVESKIKNDKTENPIKSNFQNNYSSSMKEYKLGNYENGAEKFQTILDNNKFDDILTTKLYNGACIFSLAKKNEKAIKILDYLASNRFYSNYNHITTDTDLNNLHSEPRWESIIEKVAENKKNLPEKRRKKIKPELLKAKQLLSTDNGKLWGTNIWSDDILVLSFDNTIYSLKHLPDSKTNDSIIFYKKIPKNTLGFSNAVQEYNGKEYAVVLTNYLNDNSATIIHELFHILQNKHINLNGNAITYLDNYDAREWLRLEYQALKNSLNSIDQQKNKLEVEKYINDALIFRKLRQTKYKEFLKNEIEIETSEGLANYTGFLLSTYPNKYQKVMDEINMRERAQTYTRPFPYATGPAYGLIFDYLKINWKIGLDTTYNFLNIYETKYLKDEIKITNKKIILAQQRNNYGKIHKEELERKIKNEKILNYYTEMFLNKPTLQVSLIENRYSNTSDMNGTITLKDRGTVFSQISGKDITGTNFGNFSTISGKEGLGISGVLKHFDGKVVKYIFPLPISIKGKKIIGEHYTIELRDGWEIIETNEKGDLEIVKKKE